ncbi:MAG: hypothetical protein ABMA13_12115 [Chthoniobacteraceae bacterium]
MSRFLAAAGRFVDRIKINTLHRHQTDGRAVWSKRRRRSAPLVIAMANGFFRIANNPVTILTEPRSWHGWEIASMRALHGAEFRAWSGANGTLWTDELPGRSISAHLDEGTATGQMFMAAARELRRAHAIECAQFGGGWSHGDPHSGNVIFDETARRARLLDFEVRHLGAIPADARHADDVLVFLQDTLGRLPRDRWLELATTFVAAYARPEITARLVERLMAPRGMATVWWAVRTTYLAPAEVAGRLEALREALAN